MTKAIPMEADLLKIRKKVETKSNWTEYTKDERALVEASFDAIQKVYGSSARAQRQCDNCAPDIIKIVRNWLNIMDKRPVERPKKTLKEKKPAPPKVKTTKAKKETKDTEKTDYSKLKHYELKSLCKEKGIKAKPSYDKATLVKLLEESDK